jgi:hypothetical protein
MKTSMIEVYTSERTCTYLVSFDTAGSALGAHPIRLEMNMVGIGISPDRLHRHLPRL